MKKYNYSQIKSNYNYSKSTKLSIPIFYDNNYLQNAFIGSVLLSAVTLQYKEEYLIDLASNLLMYDCRFTSSGENELDSRWAVTDGMIGDLPVEIKNRSKYDLGFFVKYPILIEEKKLNSLKEKAVDGKSYYVNFVSQEEFSYNNKQQTSQIKTYMIVHNAMEIEAELTQKLLPKETSGGKREMILKDVRFLSLEQGTIWDVTEELNNNIPSIIKSLEIGIK